MKQRKAVVKRAVVKPAGAYINEFLAAWTRGIKGLVEAAEIYAKAIERNPRYADEFQEQCRNVVPGHIWGKLEAVGNGSLDYRLLIGGHGVSSPTVAQKIQRLSGSVQKKVLDGTPVKYVAPDNKETTIDLRQATTEQARQICGDGHLRSPEEQKAWRQAQSAKDAVQAKYEIIGKEKGKRVVWFARGTSLTESEFAAIAEALGK